MRLYKHLSGGLLWMTSLIFALSIVSCQSNDETLGLYVRKNPVQSETGDVFLEVTATGSWNLTASYPDPGQAEWLSFVNGKEGTGNKSSIILHFAENTANEPRKVIISVHSGKQTRSLELVQQGAGGTGGGEHGSYGAKSAKFRWMELPVTDPDDGYEFFVHNMKIGSIPTRNYSFYWDYDHKVSLWVAYPLNPWNIGTYRKRTDAWGYDPLLPEDKQAYIGSTYGGGWSRGHQIPSADRLGTYDNNAMTFYSTNMTPQDYDFNGGIWAKLEGSVRNLCKKSDTLYVVTGCVLGSNPSIIRDRNGKTIAVPIAYYKALLFYSRKSSLAKYSHYSGCGVYMEHSSKLAGSPKDYTMTIKELEQKTGIDFFANLPSIVGKDIAEKIETQAPDWLPW